MLCLPLVLISAAFAEPASPADKLPAGLRPYTPDGLRVPMCWKSPKPLDTSKSYLLVLDDKRAIVAQPDKQNRLWWIGSPKDTHFLQLMEQGADSAVRHVKVEPEGDDKINVTIDGKPFTTFHHNKTESRPYLYPVFGPTLDPVTRNWPMKDVREEKDAKPTQQDHDHHRSFWTAHGDVRTPAHPDKGIDYWATDRRDKDGKVIHSPGHGWQRVTRIVRAVSGPVFGEIVAEVDWMTDEGKRELSDTRTYRFFRGTDGQRVIDYELVLHFPESDVTFADTKEGGLLATRIATSMTEKPGKGHMVNSNDKKGMDDCWAERADWCDYVGPVNKKEVGVAIFDNPANFRHPTRWHIRDYGLYTANPFMGHKDKKEIAEDGGATWKKGENVSFHYRVVIHTDDTQQAHIADQYAAYAKPVPIEIEK
jgi:Family of unknown function (DUF6807)